MARLIVGVTDRDRHFHIVALAVTTNEQTKDFSFLFRAIKTAAQQYNQTPYEPHVLVCDASKAIQNGFTEIFGDEPCIRMCWAHVKTNIHKNSYRCSNKLQIPLIIQDLDTLQLSSSPPIFEEAAESFLAKWADQKEFCEYFKKEWLIQNKNWFEGADRGSPSTNNALEAFNRVIKDCGTFRRRFALGQFLNVCSKLVADWSSEYVNNKIFVLTPTISLKLWTTAYQWVTTNKEMQIVCVKRDGDLRYWRIPAKSMKQVKKFEKKWVSFDEFKEQNFNCYEVRISDTRWLEAVCNCPSFFKKFICKHVVGIAIRCKYTTAPPAARNLSIGQKRKRGRPALAKHALIIQ